MSSVARQIQGMTVRRAYPVTAPEQVSMGLLDPPGIWQGLAGAPLASFRPFFKHVFRGSPCQKWQVALGRPCQFLEPCHALVKSQPTQPHTFKLMLSEHPLKRVISRTYLHPDDVIFRAWRLEPLMRLACSRLQKNTANFAGTAGSSISSWSSRHKMMDAGRNYQLISKIIILAQDLFVT